MTFLSQLEFLLAWPAEERVRLDEIADDQQTIIDLLNRLLGMGLGDARRDIQMSATLDRIIEVARKNTDATQAGVDAINALSALVREATDDPEVLAKLDEIEANSGRLMTAVLEDAIPEPTAE